MFKNNNQQSSPNGIRFIKKKKRKKNKEMASDERCKIFTACTTEINLKQTPGVIHRRKFSFTEVDAGRLKHNNEVVIPRDPSSLGSRTGEDGGREGGRGGLRRIR